MGRSPLQLRHCLSLSLSRSLSLQACCDVLPRQGLALALALLTLCGSSLSLGPLSGRYYAVAHLLLLPTCCHPNPLRLSPCSSLSTTASSHHSTKKSSESFAGKPPHLHHNINTIHPACIFPTTPLNPFFFASNRPTFAFWSSSQLTSRPCRRQLSRINHHMLTSTRTVQTHKTRPSCHSSKSPTSRAFLAQFFGVNST